MSLQLRVLALCAIVVPSSLALDPDLLAGMAARSIGPAGMSGRVASIDGAASDPDLLWVGAATGGAWKSTNGGLTWQPMFDEQPVAAVGTVRIYQPSPDIVWLGTGEGNPRNSVSVGNGVYRTLDGGAHWEHLGLEATERIHRIELPVADDPDVAVVCALGREWGENPERGVFRTTDGGKSWDKILYVDPKTGCADLVVDPGNPRRMLAAMWEFRRWPWSFKSGGAGSGLYLTLDGGESWQRLTPEDGLPAGDLGRMGLAFAPSDPKRAYALIETRGKLAIWASDDGGASWRKAGDDDETGNRPFYYADIHVDGAWPDTIYSLWSLVSRSTDGGKSFETIVPFNAAHPDHHALWINPNDPEHMVLGNDGGVAISRDRGATWDFVANLPLAQYYHIHIDMDRPYNVYGGMQDNGSWRGPAYHFENGGIRNHHWEEVGFGDGFDTRPHPEDSTKGYSMSQEGFLYRWDLTTGERAVIRPPAPRGVELRFNWNAGIGQDPFDADTIYYGSQFVHRSRDRGDSWEIISPDLTTDNEEWQKQGESGGLTADVTGAENFVSILSIAPSALERGLIWIGTDDGRLHLTRDGGDSWTSVESKLRGVPANTWIPHVVPSPHDAGSAFVVLDNHRRSDWTPYVYRTTDYGKSFKRIAGEGDVEGYALSIAQDPVDPQLLFLGTEFGLWVSRDGGGDWFKWTHGFPTVGVRDLVIHPREHDLVIGTHGRAAYVLDDVSPLRKLTAAVQAKDLHLFAIPDAEQRRIKQTGASRFPGAEEFRGENRRSGAALTLWLSGDDLPHPDEEKERARKQAQRATKSDDDAEDEKEEKLKPEVTVVVRDADGDRIRRFKADVRQGINRLRWDLRRDAFRRPDAGEDNGRRGGPFVPPGTYTVEVSRGETTVSKSVVVRGDSRFAISNADRRARYRAQVEAGELRERLTEAIDTILERRREVEREIADLEREEAEWKRESWEAADAGETSPQDEALEAAREKIKKLKEAEKLLRVPPDAKGIPEDKSPNTLVGRAQRFLGSSFDRPSAAQLEHLKRAREALEEALEELEIP